MQGALRHSPTGDEDQEARARTAGAAGRRWWARRARHRGTWPHHANALACARSAAATSVEKPLGDGGRRRAEMCPRRRRKAGARSIIGSASATATTHPHMSQGLGVDQPNGPRNRSRSAYAVCQIGSGLLDLFGASPMQENRRWATCPAPSPRSAGPTLHGPVVARACYTAGGKLSSCAWARPGFRSGGPVRSGCGWFAA